MPSTWRPWGLRMSSFPKRRAKHLRWSTPTGHASAESRARFGAFNLFRTTTLSCWYGQRFIRAPKSAAPESPSAAPRLPCGETAARVGGTARAPDARAQIRALRSLVSVTATAPALGRSRRPYMAARVAHSLACVRTRMETNCWHVRNLPQHSRDARRGAERSRVAHGRVGRP